MNTTSINIKLSLKEKKRLNSLALSYGLSLPELSRYVLTELASKIPEESWFDYKNHSELRASFSRALFEWKKGKIYTKLES